MSDFNSLGRSTHTRKPLPLPPPKAEVRVGELDDLIALADGLRNASMYMAAAHRLSAQDVPAASPSIFAIEKAMEELNLVRFALIRICEYVVLDDVH
jgi:hypothetical protein